MNEVSKILTDIPFQMPIGENGIVSVRMRHIRSTGIPSNPKAELVAHVSRDGLRGCGRIRSHFVAEGYGLIQKLEAGDRGSCPGGVFILCRKSFRIGGWRIGACPVGNGITGKNPACIPASRNTAASSGKQGAVDAGALEQLDFSVSCGGKVTSGRTVEIRQ
ncbi:hypothetical protein SDC9_185491 [bioreactor metagenome]|uniref:Uncharacterized protein n=1 Tax=bioreactor metagenome TaxID=1076179 RepID=A0A645HGW0_9ZZZZ